MPSRGTRSGFVLAACITVAAGAVAAQGQKPPAASPPQLCEVDHAGRISKCGDRLTRSLLFEAAGVLLSRSRAPSALKDWGHAVARRNGYSKARVAVARKLGITMHRLWIDGTEFKAATA